MGGTPDINKDMAMKGTYVITGVVAAAAILGFAGYKQMESNRENGGQLLVDTGGSSGLVSSPGTDNGLPPGSSIGDGNPTPGGDLGAEAATPRGNGMNRGNGQFGRGPDRGQPSMGRPNGSGRQGGTQINPGGENPSRPTQPGERRGGPPTATMSEEDSIFGMGSMILGDEKVLAELKLDAGQKEAIAQAIKAPQGGANNQSQNPEEAVQSMLSAGEERGKKVKAILNDAQEKRFKQLVYQSFGPSALLQPNMMTQFGISESEGKKMQEAAQAFMQEQMKNFQSGNIDMNAIAKKKDELDKSMINALDEDSRNKWKAAIGAPFKFSSPMGMGGMGGMFGRGGGRGPGGGGRRPGGS